MTDDTAPQLLRTIEEVRRLRAAQRRSGRSLALVPTMGALHEGHLELVRHAQRRSDAVLVSIFVNPLQFGANEDLDRYPRTLEADLQALAGMGVDHVFAPSAAEMYPTGPSRTRVTAGEAGTLFEGRTRPGHFDGMLTVVAKLFNIVQPELAAFGQKDAQQLFLIRRMVAELNLPLELLAVPIVREADGLALSSRNRYLDAAERQAAAVLSRALQAASEAAASGADVEAALARAAEHLAAEPLVTLDYLAIVDPGTFEPLPSGTAGEALVLVAAKVGSTRLIDNEPIRFG